MSTSNLPSPKRQVKIAIIGAGPAGCVLARLLHLHQSRLSPAAAHSLSITVFESEPSPNYRSQGGTLDLHTSTGLAALKEAGLFPQFLAKARYDGDHLQFTDRNLKVFFEIVGAGVPVLDEDSDDNRNGKSKKSGLSDQRPEIDRADLRRILTESIPPDMIRWDCHLTGYDPATGTLFFSSSGDKKTAFQESGFHLVIGADGAWSKIRTALSPSPSSMPLFAGVGMYELSIPNAKTSVPEIHAAIKGGSVFAHAEGRRLCLQMMGDESISIYALQRQDNEAWAPSDGTDIEKTKHSLLDERDAPFGEDWHPLLRQAIREARGKCTPRTLYQLPVGFQWEHRRGATLVGDAAHLMTPYAGEGVNVALEDAMGLAKAVIEVLENWKEEEEIGEALDRAVVKYEEEMWPRAERVARLTDELTKAWMFTPDTPASVIARTTAMHVRFHTPGILHPLATVGVHLYFFWKRLSGR